MYFGGFQSWMGPRITEIQRIDEEEEEEEEEEDIYLKDFPTGD